MAKLELIYARAWLIVLVFCYGITSINARILRPHESTSSDCCSLRRHLSRYYIHFESKAAGPLHTNAQSEDFRPTTPGHSPGAGHSAHPQSAIPSPIINTQDHRDDFEPTNPGHSPGVGHSTQPEFSPSGPVRVQGETDDFQPTTPGHSPGAGHSGAPH
ncbi:hypothetical protein Tsubulata_031617 [Turnera subulata]|uniref:Uncharacterized protein n=1 Tax=Turnera subulata TaxID=218843 RepID=A0A9Q0G1W9_9ROSI|nr:hypothetical protein Tsubulata_031617 [Turnera subulata]